MALDPNINPYASPASAGDSIAPTGSVIEVLERTRPWVLVIAWFITIGLVIGGAALVIMFAVALAGVRGAGPAETVIPGFMGLFMAVMYGYPLLCLFRFAGRIKRLSSSGNIDDLVGALDAQRAFWKFIGVLMLIVLAFYAVAFLVGGLAML